MAQPSGRSGVDIGGTFTDVALELGNTRWSAKILPTPQAQYDVYVDLLPPVPRWLRFSVRTH